MLSGRKPGSRSGCPGRPRRPYRSAGASFWQLDTHAGAAFGAVVGEGAAGVGLGNALNQGESEAERAMAALALAKKGLEHPRQILAGEPGAAVDDLEHDELLLAVKAQPSYAAAM